jgi:hypothetical protein
VGLVGFNCCIERVAAVGGVQLEHQFMHPVPRGIPILETASAVTAEINRSRDYLNKLLSDA